MLFSSGLQRVGLWPSNPHIARRTWLTNSVALPPTPITQDGSSGRFQSWQKHYIFVFEIVIVRQELHTLVHIRHTGLASLITKIALLAISLGIILLSAVLCMSQRFGRLPGHCPSWDVLRFSTRMRRYREMVFFPNQRAVAGIEMPWVY